MVFKSIRHLKEIIRRRGKVRREDNSLLACELDEGDNKKLSEFII